MKMKFLGRSGAFATLNEGNTNAVITINDKNLLIDFGVCSNFVWLEHWRKSYHDIDAIYISHLHLDHCCLERLFFSRYFLPKLDKNDHVVKPKLYANPTVMQEIWEHLKPSMGVYRNEMLHLTNFAECHSCSEFEFEGIQIQLIKNDHIKSSFANKDAYGLFFKIGNQNVYWSSDSANINTKMIDKATIVFHDCETLPDFKSRVHAHWSDLKKLKPEQKNKMWLMHYNTKPDDYENRGFAGWIEKDQEFQFN
jgi:ribonuclease BN (tRNA processing enzyme)